MSANLSSQGENKKGVGGSGRTKGRPPIRSPPSLPDMEDSELESWLKNKFLSHRMELDLFLQDRQATLLLELRGRRMPQEEGPTGKTFDQILSGIRNSSPLMMASINPGLDSASTVLMSSAATSLAMSSAPPDAARGPPTSTAETRVERKRPSFCGQKIPEGLDWSQDEETSNGDPRHDSGAVTMTRTESVEDPEKDIWASAGSFQDATSQKDSFLFVWYNFVSQMRKLWIIVKQDVKSSFWSAPKNVSLAKRLRQFVRSTTFELCFVCIILGNAVVMALQLQYSGLEYGYHLSIKDYSRPADSVWPGMGDRLQAVDYVFLSVFALELMVRLFAYGWDWFFSLWNYVDLFIVISAIISASPAAISEIDPTVVRLVRFGKLFRLVRILRAENVMETLHLLMTCLRVCFSTLFWSVCILMLLQVIAGMLVCQLLGNFMADDNNPVSVRIEVFQYYGTFWRSMITMFEVMFGNWAPPCRILLDEVSEAYGLFFLLYRCIIGFAVLCVIQAVFIQQTMKIAQQDTDFMMQQKRREIRSYVRKLERLFRALDHSGDGYVSWDEFEPLMMNPQMRLLLSTLGLETRDVDELFMLLDDGDGRLSTEEFIEGVQRMKGQAKALDVVILAKATRRLEAKLDSLGQQVGLSLPPHPHHHHGPSVATRLPSRVPSVDELSLG